MDAATSDPSLAFAAYALLAYEVIAAVNSSPQTTEINARKRAKTLMKWVNLAMGQIAIFTAIGIYYRVKTDKPVTPVLLGAGLGSAMLYGQYVYAKSCGLNSSEPGTENY